VRRLYLICVGFLLCGLLAGIAADETFLLDDGQSVTGEIILPANNDGLNIRVGQGKYERVPWARFSQETLRELVKNPKIAPFVEPFIEITPEERVKKTDVQIRPVSRLELPPSRSLFGAMFSSGVGVFVLLLLYAANVYAGYEVAIFRAQSVPLVCGVSAVAPVIGPIIFLAMPTRIQPTAAEERAAEGIPEPEAPTFAVPTAEPAAEADSGGLRIAHRESGAGGGHVPPPQVFQRGAFTFNRRFLETKFPGFFAVVRREAERDMVLLVKTTRGEHNVERITRIAASEVHLQVHRGGASQEVTVPFSEIQEIQLKHKNA
jgi:hypothetical protein